MFSNSGALEGHTARGTRTRREISPQTQTLISGESAWQRNNCFPAKRLNGAKRKGVDHHPPQAPQLLVATANYRVPPGARRCRDHSSLIIDRGLKPLLRVDSFGSSSAHFQRQREERSRSCSREGLDLGTDPINLSVRVLNLPILSCCAQTPWVATR